jgi:hypothetical protein
MPPEYATTRELDDVKDRNGILEKRIAKAAEDSREDARETRESLALLTKCINDAVVNMTSCTGQIIANEKSLNEVKDDVKEIQDKREAEALTASTKATEEAKDETKEVKGKFKSFLDKHWAVLLIVLGWLISLA